VRLFANLYTNNVARVSWCLVDAVTAVHVAVVVTWKLDASKVLKKKSFFYIRNGVRQGGIVSPVLIAYVITLVFN